MLIALKLWMPVWGSKRCVLWADTDNWTTISMLSKLKSSTTSLRKIAKELALLFTQVGQGPEIIQHVPGVSHVIADALSRRFETEGWTIPTMLLEHNAPEAHPPTRDLQRWSTPSLP